MPTTLILLRIVVSILAISVVGVAYAEQKLQTTFGLLTIDDDQIVRIDGAPVRPPLEVNGRWAIDDHHRRPDRAIVLLRDDGGVGCPAQYVFLILAKRQVSATERFGTCAEERASVWSEGPDIVVSMPGFKGPMESKDDQARAKRELHVYRLVGNKVTHTPPKVTPSLEEARARNDSKIKALGLSAKMLDGKLALQALPGSPLANLTLRDYLARLFDNPRVSKVTGIRVDRYEGFSVKVPGNETMGFAFRFDEGDLFPVYVATGDTVQEVTPGQVRNATVFALLKFLP